MSTGDWLTGLRRSPSWGASRGGGVFRTAEHSQLRDHLTDDLSVAALARQINLSERQFSRVFKAEVGPLLETR